ncbi:GNAT family N-acetyltransferase [Streptomyces sp. SPB074]|uniref:GNAT family N-acetyltransferase n=1 Tax=Streptomyces sp. (strain SPB074) TaxID=465543 RepID=UPI00017F23FC|nr:GNAT family N-acetyltransferase [Streptomyces sp. SPB074]EDY43481.1 acetyltransferase [Streptomyces sp. SPB074]
MTETRQPAFRTRPARGRDTPFLELMLLEAFNWDGPRFTLAGLLAVPGAAHYVTGWRRPGDFGVVAEDTRGHELGAAWARRFPAADPGYGHVAPDIPELTLAVTPGRRGAGVGGTVLDALVLAAAERGCPGLSLRVEDGNRARALYERRGFVPVGREGNADTLLLRLGGCVTGRGTGVDSRARVRARPGAGAAAPPRPGLRSATPAAVPPPRTGPPGPC